MKLIFGLVLVSLGMCKHIHIGLAKAEDRGISVEDARSRVAMKLFQDKSYHEDNGEIVVYDGEFVSTVLHGNRCTCVAASHGLTCLCQQIAIMVSEVATGSASDVVAPVDNAVPSETDADDLATQKLHEIAAFLSSGKEHTSHATIIKEVNKLHSLVFNAPFKKITKKRKIGPNSASRKIIDNAIKRKRLTQTDHMYPGINSTKRKSSRRADGAFRRVKQSRKSSFQ
jgi:hypothetical protein